MVPFVPKICTKMRPLRPQAERLRAITPEAPLSSSISVRGDVVGLDRRGAPPSLQPGGRHRASPYAPQTRRTPPNRTQISAQGMDAEIVERAIAGARLALPVEERLRIRHEVLVHLDAHMVDRADPRPRRAGRAMRRIDRVLDVVVAERRDLAARRAPPRASARHRQAASPSASRTRHACPPPAPRSPSRDGTALGVVIETTSTAGSATSDAPVAGGARKAELARLALGEFLRCLGKHAQAAAAPHRRRRRDGVPGQRMALAHVAGADQADAERCHVSAPESIA